MDVWELKLYHYPSAGGLKKKHSRRLAVLFLNKSHALLESTETLGSPETYVGISCETSALSALRCSNLEQRTSGTFRRSAGLASPRPKMKAPTLKGSTT